MLTQNAIGGAFSRGLNGRVITRSSGIINPARAKYFIRHTSSRRGESAYHRLSDWQVILRNSKDVRVGVAGHATLIYINVEIGITSFAGCASIAGDFAPDAPSSNSHLNPFKKRKIAQPRVRLSAR
jgi:hypothetical protein